MLKINHEIHTIRKSAKLPTYAGPSQGLRIREGLVVQGGDNVPPPLVEIGLNDLPKTGGAKAL